MALFLDILKIPAFAACAWWGGKIAMAPHSFLEAMGGVALCALAAWIFTTLFRDSVPLGYFSGRLFYSPPPAQEMGEGKRFFLALLALGCVVAQDRFMHRENWLFFVAALFLAVFFLFFLEKKSLSFFVKGRETDDPLKWDWRQVTVLMLVGGVFLFYRLSSFPNFMSNDEQADLKTAVAISQGRFYFPFCVEAGDNPTLVFFVLGAGIKLFGVSVFSAALASAFVNWLVLPLYYGFARFFVPSTTAFMAALLLASSHWTSFFIRTPREVCIVPAVTILALYFFAKAMHTGKRRDYAWLGVCMALCLHVYLPGKAVLLFILASVYVLAFFMTKDFYRTRYSWLLAGSLFALWMIPLSIWYYHNPNTLMNRMNELSIFSESPAKAVQILLFNLKATVLMFSVRGSGDPHFNLPHLQMLDPLAAAFMWLGLAWCLVHLLRFPAFLLVLGFWVTLTTVLFSDGAHPMRSLINAPFCYLLAAVGADRVFRAVTALFAGPGVFLRRSLVFLFLAFAVGWNYNAFFNLKAKSKDVYEAGEGKGLLLENFYRDHSSGWIWYKLAHVSYSSHCFMTGTVRPFVASDNLPLPEVPQDGAGIILFPDLGRLMQEPIAYYYPNAKFQILKTPFGDESYWVWEMTPEDVKKALESTARRGFVPLEMKYYSQEGLLLGSRQLPVLRNLSYFTDKIPGEAVSFVFRTELEVDQKTQLSLEGVGDFAVFLNSLPVTQVSSTRPQRALFQLEPGVSRLRVKYVPQGRNYLLNLDEMREGNWAPLSMKAYREPSN